MLKTDTELCSLLGIRYPIVQAGMAGGATTPELAAAVSQAGGLGTIGAAYMEPEALREAVRKIRILTHEPFAVNVFAVQPPDDFSRLEEVQRALKPFREELNLPAPPDTYESPDRREALLEVCLEQSVPVISTAFGCLDRQQTRKIKEKGIKLIAMATTVEEGLEAQEAGADAVTAQGAEAGGHRGTFSLDRHPDGALIGLMSLVPQMADTLRVPVIAAGGIADGRGIAASLALGAAGVQIGTLFLTAKEAGIHPLYKKAVFEADGTDTVVTKSFSGRPARGIRNRFINEFEKSGTAPLPFPSQNTVTKELRAAAGKQGEPELMSLWAGQSAGMMTEEAEAAAIVRRLIEEAKKVLG
ncbi:NAD(P)H-dependent flavin oxidoreductase [Indiicoccus explosivorum]|uniref:NAD(P)H-dependent flavin oxidoreductase n=1 Tax=Indiicoccus explosivorum TaxID=1917864 RepID=UPI000B43AAF8|nr:nitronate monooxygenase family protein [Indiicoccus explosivorum]